MRKSPEMPTERKTSFEHRELCATPALNRLGPGPARNPASRARRRVVGFIGFHGPAAPFLRMAGRSISKSSRSSSLPPIVPCVSGPHVDASPAAGDDGFHRDPPGGVPGDCGLRGRRVKPPLRQGTACVERPSLSPEGAAPDPIFVGWGIRPARFRRTPIRRHVTGPFRKHVLRVAIKVMAETMLGSLQS